MKKQLDQVLDFHQKFKQSFNTSPTLLPPNESELRFKLGQEELNEYKEAVADENIIEILDSLADQAYILFGTVIKHGLQDKFIEAFNLVHQNNMNKLDTNGEPILREDGKILKPENFQKVELKTLFNEKD